MNQSDSQYKEVIYLDQIEIDSALAQLEKGLKESIQNGDSSSETAGTSATVNGGAAGALDAIFAKGKVNVSSSMSTNSNNSENISQTINVVLNDYKIERLLTILQDDETNVSLKSNVEETNDGDFVLINSSFQITDFNLFQQFFSNKGIKNIIRATKDDNNKSNWNKEVETGFKLGSNVGDTGNALFGDNILITTNDSVSYAERKNFRMNTGQLQLLAGTYRSVNVLGIVESKLGSSKNNADNVTEGLENGLSQIGNVATSMSEMFLTTTNFAKENDRLIKPIAIFF